MAAMEAFLKNCATLIENKIPVASILLNSTSEARRAGDDFIDQEKHANTGHWLIDNEKSSLGSLMRVSSFPTVVLVSNKGKILFNGDPTNPRLWQNLTAINPEINLPTIDVVLSKTDEKRNLTPKNSK